MTTPRAARRAEQITATVLFADVVGFSGISSRVGAEKAYLAVTELLRTLDAIARKHGGSVDKYQGDKLMAVFGYPVPLEHPARAAANAALEMHQRVVTFNRDTRLPIPFALRVGINTGELVGGDIRGPVVREFHVLGDAVNVSARLNAKAPVGRTWVGQRTYQEARHEFEWARLEPLRLKGKSQPVPVHELVRARLGQASEQLGFDARLVTDLVGRDAELTRLRETCDAFASGRGGAVLLLGDAESGKSRLLAALGETLEFDRITVSQARGFPGQQDRPLSALTPLLNESKSEDDPGSSEADREAAAKIEATIRSSAQSGPTLLVLEDLQWLDSSSLELLSRLLRIAQDLPLLLLLTARPCSLATRVVESMQSALGADSQTIELKRLDQASAEDLVRAVLDGANDDDATVELVLERGRGLPGALLRAAFLAPSLRSERDQASSRADRTSEAERRRAVVVFADLTGFTAMTEKVGADTAYPVVALCLELLDEVARVHGGTVDHYLGDCVMALFGVPRALEEAPRAALNAAIEMRRQIREFSRSHDLPVEIDVHIGVAMGLGITGDISGPLIREFAVMGDHVDRADALTHAAQAGEIRVDRAVYEATREIFEFSESERLLLPGAAELQPNWDLVSTSPHLHRSGRKSEGRIFSELVGREDELARLGKLFESIAAGDGGIASVVAEAGVGKSRLLAELRSRHAAPLWLEGRSISNGRNLSYHPIADLLRSWVAIDDGDDDLAARFKLDAKISAFLPTRAQELGPLLASLLGVGLTREEREKLEVVQGDALEKLVRSAVLQVLRAASEERPVVVLMEDLHWADLSSVELLESVVRLAKERPILFLNAFRPGFEDTSGRVLAFADENLADCHVRVELEPLAAAAARTLVKNLFRGGDVPQKTRAAIEERAQGNPFYIEELVRNLVDAGALVFREGGLQATDKIESVVIPDSVHDAVLARIDRLDLGRRSVLQAASVIGQVFHREVLEGIVGNAEHFDDWIEGLEVGEFIVPADRSAGAEYAFKHPLIQDVTYDSMLELRRRELHLEVAQAVKVQLEDSQPGYCAMLAYHYSKGDDVEHAEEYLFRAGDEAARGAASNEALHFFQEASTLYTNLPRERRDPSREALLEKNLAIALLNRGRLIEAVDHFDRSAERLGKRAPRGSMAMAASFAADLASVMSRIYLRRRPYGHRASTERDRELVDVMFRRAMAQSTSAPTRFLVDSMSLINRFSTVDPRTVPESAAIYAGVIAIFSYGGLSFGVASRFLEIASELAESGAVEERVLYYRTLRFLHHLLRGDWSDANAIEAEAVDLGLRDGRFWEASTYVNLDGVRQLYQGHFDEARQRVAKLAEIADLYQHDLAASAQHALTAYLHVERREFEPALAALEVYYDEHAEATFNLLALGTRAKVQCLMGDLEGAKENLRRAKKVLSEAGRVAPYHASSVHSAQYLADVIELEKSIELGPRVFRESLRRVKKSRAMALQTANRVAFRLPEVLRLAGREAWICGRPRVALDWWKQAHDCCLRLGARPELGRTLAEAGLALRAGLPGELYRRDAAACLAEARSIFESLDLAFDLAQITDAA